MHLLSAIYWLVATCRLSLVAFEWPCCHQLSAAAAVRPILPIEVVSNHYLPPASIYHLPSLHLHTSPHFTLDR
jgi:hypothetical protein